MSLRKKLIHVIHLDGPGGGPKTVFSHISYYSHFFDVEVLHGGKGFLARGCDSLKVPHTRIPLETAARSLWGFFVLTWHLLQKRPDLLVLHGQWAGPLGAIAGKVARIPRIIYICQWPSFYTDWDLKRVIRNYLSEWVPCRFCDRVIAISPGNFYQYRLRFPNLKERLGFLPNSLDPLDIPNVAEIDKVRLSEKWSPELCHVVSVGRLSTQKRVDWLLEAWKLVQDKCPNARLWIIGDGELMQEMQDLAVKLELKNYAFLGSRPNARNYIAAADIVAMTSMYEGHANVPLEALSVGRPLVANKVDGVKETFSDGVEGFLVPPADHVMFADRLVQLIGDQPLREKMGLAGLKRAPLFNRGHILNRYLDMLAELLGNWTPPKEVPPTLRNQKIQPAS